MKRKERNVKEIEMKNSQKRKIEKKEHRRKWDPKPSKSGSPEGWVVKRWWFLKCARLSSRAAGTKHDNCFSTVLIAILSFKCNRHHKSKTQSKLIFRLRPISFSANVCPKSNWPKSSVLVHVAEERKQFLVFCMSRYTSPTNQGFRCPATSSSTVLECDALTIALGNTESSAPIMRAFTACTTQFVPFWLKPFLSNDKLLARVVEVFFWLASPLIIGLRV